MHTVVTESGAATVELGVRLGRLLEPGDFIWTGGDCHIYVNQFDGVREQLSREPRPLPRLIIKRKPSSILEYRFEDFEIAGYDPHPPIKYSVAV